MKKKSLLLAISAMSIAAIGVGTVGTFAWYTASSATKAAAVAGESGTIGVQDNTYTAGAVKFTASFVKSNGTAGVDYNAGINSEHDVIYLTDTSGNVNYLVGSSLTPDVARTASDARWATATLKITATLDGGSAGSTLAKAWDLISTTAEATVTMAQKSNGAVANGVRVSKDSDTKFNPGAGDNQFTFTTGSGEKGADPANLWNKSNANAYVLDLGLVYFTLNGEVITESTTNTFVAEATIDVSAMNA